ncbi:MAG TPA: type II secretion system F family protein [Mycobacteriales bacterium]|nr:type II secretion system F family protein [Mycobacteriales bacterium]
MIGLALAGLGLLIWPTRLAVAASERVAQFASTPGDEPASAAERSTRIATRARMVALAAGSAVVLVFPSILGLVAGAALAVALDRVLRRLEPAAVRRARSARQRDLPAVLDLLAVALHAGMPIDQAIDVVADAMAGPLSDDLHRVAAATRLGSGAIRAWEPFVDDPVWGVVARAVRRSAASGSALATTFERVAQDRRAERAQRAESAARQASVIAMAPLGLCFLPAFICIGVVPVVVGLLSGALK